MTYPSNAAVAERCKPCCTCRRPLPLSSFARCSKAPDGRQYQCKACHKKYKKGML